MSKGSGGSLSEKHVWSEEARKKDREQSKDAMAEAWVQEAMGLLDS